jgi:hypothetical protein
MGFIVGKAYPIIKSMADGGNQEAKKLLNGLDSMDQGKVDEIVSSLLGGGGNNKPSSFTDLADSYTDDLEELPKTVGEQEKMRKELRKQEIETALKFDDGGDDLPKNAMPKNMEEYREVQKLLGVKVDEPKDPLSEENLQKLFDDGLDVDEVIDKVRTQMSSVQLNPDDPMGAGDLQSVVEAFEMSYKPKPKKGMRGK